MIREFNELEKKWFDELLSPTFLEKSIIIEQIEKAFVCDETLKPYISLKLKTRCLKKYPHIERVPVIMIAHQKNGYPIEFLLHLIGGFVDELEIYDAGGEDLSYGEIDLSDLTYEIRV